jgi:hypothetical protein
MRNFLTVVALLMCCLSNGNAQTQSESAQLSDFLQTMQKKLSQSQRALVDMAGGMAANSNEYYPVSKVYERLFLTNAYIGQLYTLAAIYSQMVASKDQAILKRFFIMQTTVSIRDMEGVISATNKDSSKLQSPAVVTEVQGVKELLRKTIDEIERVVPSDRSISNAN